VFPLESGRPSAGMVDGDYLLESEELTYLSQVIEEIFLREPLLRLLKQRQRSLDSLDIEGFDSKSKQINKQANFISSVTPSSSLAASSSCISPFRQREGRKRWSILKGRWRHGTTRFCDTFQTPVTMPFSLLREDCCPTSTSTSKSTKSACFWWRLP